MKKSELQKKANTFLGYNRVNKLYAIIDGTHMMLDDFEINYLKAQCVIAPNFKDFCKRIIIHNGPTKDYPILHWDKSGRFVEKVISGFLDASGIMCISRIKAEKGKTSIKPFNLY